MSQLVSVTLLHQGSTAPVKNWRVAIKFPLSPCITFFSAVSAFLFTVETPQGNIFCE